MQTRINQLTISAAEAPWLPAKISTEQPYSPP